ncbi:phosphatidylcholine/phosphatidylserine synthase [Kaistia dalseonensis]|uniref:Phosphatidylcholine synthase n=1 Tax=Kaistia dalseonensis TaxID=410840 RepID=A0ABU0H2K9_9HYPH|nr:phosphatidylcholine/phosphatidylserine synthase [Kaistia dalseonensis]MCX5493963.1 phosphatidylcholine/phosphatidylserine synthase [Kaistia dalseonensis]MDQ0436539.1 phosphatidylcholine synthase [Kaistia dalseonensis]
MATTKSWAVHLLTASGAGLALLAALAVMRGAWTEAFIWLGAALFVDAVDGPLARTVRVGDLVPWFDGAILDLVIDYTTYVFIPALILARSDLLPPSLAAPGAVLVAVIGALYFADTRMKTRDYGFRGFPAVWNMVVFVLMVFMPPPLVSAAIILAFAVLSFAPVEFVHPVRVQKLRPVTLAVTLAWAIFSLLSVFASLEPGALVLAGLGATTVYLTVIGAVLQFTRNENAY